MNIGSIQAVVGTVKKTNTQSGNAGGGNLFGSVYNSVLASKTTKPSAVVNMVEETTLNNAIKTILNATTTEEVLGALNLNGNEEVMNDETNEMIVTEELMTVEENKIIVTEHNVSNLFEDLKLPELDQLAEMLGIEKEQLIESLVTLLEKAGLSESELESVKYTNDPWVLINIIDNVAPKLFAELSKALEGKGEIPKQQAMELLAFLKTTAITAPKMDLMMKQEQQIFTVQSFLAVTSEKLEAVNNSNQNRPAVVQLMDTLSYMRVVPQAPTGQNQPQEENLKESPKEVIQQPVVNHLSTVKSEASIAETENRNNTRNETLLKEMQNIFKRASFGQTGGTNRLMIKLYPEHLGQVRIELLQVNGIMTARILASTALGKEMLDSQSHQLRAAFLQQNLQVERIDISQTLQDTNRNEKDHAFNQHFRREQEETPEQNDQNQEEMTFQEYMIELEA